jgi:hypothetical protein
LTDSLGSFAQSATLVIGMDGDVGDVGAVQSIGESSSRADELISVVDEAHKPAVAEDGRECAGRLVS